MKHECYVTQCDFDACSFGKVMFTVSISNFLNQTITLQILNLT